MPNLDLTPEIDCALKNGATLVISISGGKDSQAMMRALRGWRKTMRWTGRVVAVHANLGRMEWGITEYEVRRQCKMYGIPLTVVKQNPDADLVDRIYNRWDKRPDAPPWPSSAARYCTSDEKRSPISRWIRNEFPTGEVVVAMGLRAEESPARAKRPFSEIRTDCTSERKGRTVWNWNPIHTWIEEEVWDEIGLIANINEWRESVDYQRRAGAGYDELIQWIRNAGFPAHPAYALGNERLSCSMCVLASKNDLINGAYYHPVTYQLLCQLEAQSGYSFRKGFWLTDLYPDRLPDWIVKAVAEHKLRTGQVEEPAEDVEMQPCLL